MLLNIMENIKEKRGIVINTVIMIIIAIAVLTAVVLLYIGFRTGTLGWIGKKINDLFRFGGIR